MAFYLGIDGGGSKTRAAVSDGSRVIATHTSGGCNLNSTSLEKATQSIGESVSGAVQAAGIELSEVSTVCAGVSGAGSPENAAKIQCILEQMFPRTSVQVVADTVIALEAYFPGAAGMVCIAGTGSIAFGRNERGEIARAGGWGRLVSDEGSGYWIGQQGVAQAIRAMDMGRSSALTDGIMQHWNVATREQVLQRCNAERMPNLAELFPVVLRASEGGDSLASEILDSAAAELARVAQIVLHRLWTGDSPIKLAITGGVFANSARVRQVFTEAVRTGRPEVEVHIDERKPYEGALYLAKKALH